MSDFLSTMGHWLAYATVMVGLAACATQENLGEFSAETDVGQPGLTGSANFNSVDSGYTITGSGANIWGGEDAFHYVWQKTAGDLKLKADVTWPAEGKNPHRKAGWMVRADLSTDAPYADAAVHGDGLISLQYRKEKGGETSEIKAPVKAPAKVLLERNGNLFSLAVAGVDNNWIPVGSILIDLPDSVYAGLFVCSHEDSVSETADFRTVSLEQQKWAPGTERILESNLEIIDITSGVRRLVYRAQDHFEAPNWSRDGGYLLFNSNGLLYTFDLTGSTPKQLPTGAAQQCNNDHGFSPDGKFIALSHHKSDESLIYTMLAAGGEPKQVTRLGPSYWHGWSPDGRTLAYCAERNGEYDIYTIPAAGGREIRLTSAKGLDDGPDYSPDGKYIYFNSVRSGLMKIWRMRSNGLQQEQISTDPDFADWFPHPSPDGKWLVFVSYDKSVSGHPPEKEVCLRLMDLQSREVIEIARFYGGQGTINVPSWSPDSKSLAFVNYRRVLP